VKLLANPKSGEILGGPASARWAAKLIHEIVAAMPADDGSGAGRDAALSSDLAEIWSYPRKNGGANFLTTGSPDNARAKAGSGSTGCVARRAASSLCHR